jgi:hypothetical protein
MNNLHRNLHYGHPCCNHNVGHDIVNPVGYVGSDTFHAAETSVPSTIHGTEQSHNQDKDSSQDAAHQPYKKMRSSIHHSTIILQCLKKHSAGTWRDASVTIKASNGKQNRRRTVETSHPRTTPMKRGKVSFTGCNSTRAGDISGSLKHNKRDLENDKMAIIDETVGSTFSSVENDTVNEALSPNHLRSPRLNVSNLPGLSLHTKSDSDAEYELSPEIYN